jgi:hypothetical protein
MELNVREIRHTILLFLIVAIVPLIFFPSDLGLRFGIPLLVYILAELIFYGSVVFIFLNSPPIRNVVIAAALSVGIRLLVGTVFAVLLFLMKGLSPGDAFVSGLWMYKPALLLHTLTTPFVLMSIFRIMFENEKEAAGKITITPYRDSLKEIKPASDLGEIKHDAAGRPSAPRIVIGQPTVEQSETIPKGFDAATKHVCELSAVKFAVLIDADGLPVAFSGDEPASRDIWSSIGRLITEQVQSSLQRTSNVILQAFDLSLDTFRIHATEVCGMWLLVCADRNSEELEKVRMNQAADMIKRTYEQKYIDASEKKILEESYV